MTVMVEKTSAREWRESRIKPEQMEKYLQNGRDFIDDDAIEARLRPTAEPDAARIRAIIAKAKAIESLDLDETAALLHVKDPELWAEMRAAAAEIKHQVYDNRIVTFAPLYVSNVCVNSCRYCGLRRENSAVARRTLAFDEIRAETEILAGKIGHKRLIVVYGEHPSSDLDYMLESIRTIYDVKVPARRGHGQIRRVNVNAAPMPDEELRALQAVGVGTYQVFQETYHKATYRAVHPAGTFKGDYNWRLYTLHRALDAGMEDVGIGALFGLYDWRFEVLGLVAHALDLEHAVGVGPHTVSFPRLEPAENTPFNEALRWQVSDDDFEKVVIVLRLAVPYAGMIVTCRENPGMRRRLLPLGCTQTDASSNIGVGGYQDAEQHGDRQQFLLADTRTLDEVVRDLAALGNITSFCTAGYRCGRTGQCIMDLLRSGAEGKFCKLNAILTFREWLDDFASAATRAVGTPLLQKEIEEVRQKMPQAFPEFMKSYERICAGERDLYF
jgi:2-iminoacetate synthase